MVHDHIVAIRGNEFCLYVAWGFTILNRWTASAANGHRCGSTDHVHVIFGCQSCVFRVGAGNLATCMVVANAPRDAVAGFASGT